MSMLLHTPQSGVTHTVFFSPGPSTRKRSTSTSDIFGTGFSAKEPSYMPWLFTPSSPNFRYRPSAFGASLKWRPCFMPMLSSPLKTRASRLRVEFMVTRRRSKLSN